MKSVVLIQIIKYANWTCVENMGMTYLFAYIYVKAALLS